MERLGTAALFLALAGQLVYAAWSDGLTNDEVLYIHAGYRYLSARDYRVNPTHPPLAKVLAGLPLLALRPQEAAAEQGATELDRAFAFVHSANRATPLIRAARAPVVLVTLLLAFLTWAWARAVLGVPAALVALAILAFHPTLLAHGHLATTDVPAATALLGAAFAFWWWWARPSGARAIVVALAVALGVATRLSTLALLPALAVFLAVHWRRRGGADAAPPGPTGRDVCGLIAAGVVAVPLILWAAYGFRYEVWPGASVLGPIPPRLGLSGRLVAAAAGARLLPEAFLESVRYQLDHNASGHPAYLLGEPGRTGWWSYPLVAFAVKNTLAFVVAAGAAVAWTLRERRREAWVAHWLLPPVFIFLAAAATRIQIGERYLLPAYPFLALVVAAAATPWLRSTAGRRGVALLLALHALPAMAALPAGYLSFFNVLAGGSAQGHRVLLDSNLDWGQDLPRLAAWMRREGVREVQLAYQGADDPTRFGIAHEDLPGVQLYPTRAPAQPFTGVVVVSPNLLFGLVPRLAETYAPLRDRPPDARAGVFFVYRLP